MKTARSPFNLQYLLLFTDILQKCLYRLLWFGRVYRITAIVMNLWLIALHNITYVLKQQTNLSYTCTSAMNQSF